MMTPQAASAGVASGSMMCTKAREARAAVDARGLLELRRDGVEIGRQDQDGVGQQEAGLRDDHAAQRVELAQRAA